MEGSKMPELIGITVKFTEKEYNALKRLVDEGHYATFSEAVRKAVREFLEKEGVW